MKGRFLPPLYFIYLSVIYYLGLMLLYNANLGTVWIDRALVFEIQAVAAFTFIAIALRTKRDEWTRRGLGILGFMFAVFVLTTISQLIEWEVIHRPAPQWIINIYRSPLSLGCMFIIYGYVMYFQGKGWDDERRDGIK